MLPEHGSKKFKCPHCHTIATQEWSNAFKISTTSIKILDNVYLDYRSQVQDYAQEEIARFISKSQKTFKDNIYNLLPKDFSVATCISCEKFTLWVDKEIVYPKKTTVPSPNEDLDEDIKALYLEASTILIDSPKGSTALLRLALQMLLKQVGKSGNKINDDIKELVSEGLSPKIQQALDLLRVIGNNAVHPGQINLDDDTEVAEKLFNILNFIADELITKPKELEGLYADLIPLETQEHIRQRDKQK